MGRTSTDKKASTKKITEEDEDYLKRIKSMKAPAPPKEEPLPPKPVEPVKFAQPAPASPKPAEPVKFAQPAPASPKPAEPVKFAQPAPKAVKQKATDNDILKYQLEYTDMMARTDASAPLNKEARNGYITQKLIDAGFDVSNLQDRLMRRFRLGPYA